MSLKVNKKCEKHSYHGEYSILGLIETNERLFRGPLSLSSAWALLRFQTKTNTIHDPGRPGKYKFTMTCTRFFTH